jgi:tetratricopeptide (TPR) repeat protein
MTLLKTIIIENNLVFYLITVSVFSCNIYSQKVKSTVAQMKDTLIASPTSSEAISKLVRTVITYKVVEKVNMTFGGYKIIYVVSDLNLINSYDLGPNNTRVVTPIFEKKEQIIHNKQEAIIDSLKPIQNNFNSNISVNINIPEKPIDEISDEPSNGVEYIDIVKTYEKVVDKGFKSVEMLKRLGDAYYFKGKLDKAARFYKDLLDMTSDLDAEFYFRYAQSLKFINKKDKANEMMKIFNQKNNGL